MTIEQIGAQCITASGHVNAPTVHDEAQMPFGGVKGSGMGRFGGRAGVNEFTELRWITIQTTPRHYPFHVFLSLRLIGVQGLGPRGAMASLV